LGVCGSGFRGGAGAGPAFVPMRARTCARSHATKSKNVHARARKKRLLRTRREGARGQVLLKGRTHARTHARTRAHTNTNNTHASTRPHTTHEDRGREREEGEGARIRAPVANERAARSSLRDDTPSAITGTTLACGRGGWRRLAAVVAVLRLWRSVGWGRRLRRLRRLVRWGSAVGVAPPPRSRLPRRREGPGPRPLPPCLATPNPFETRDARPQPAHPNHTAKSGGARPAANGSRGAI
jgi:hypothetical protein